MEDIRVRLGEEIKRMCFSHALLARKAGMTPQQLTDVLKLRRKLDANEMFALCDAMGIECSDLRPSK